MTNYQIPIVGMHFRPPAKAFMQVLPSKHQLILKPEPENKFDSNAIAVYALSADLPADLHEELNILATPMGYSIEDILQSPEWQLGYIAAKDAAVIIKEMLTTIGLNRTFKDDLTVSTRSALNSRNTWWAFLTFNGMGKPMADINFAERV